MKNSGLSLSSVNGMSLISHLSSEGSVNNPFRNCLQPSFGTESARNPSDWYISYPGGLRRVRCQRVKSNAVTLLDLSLDKRADALAQKHLLSLVKKVTSFMFVDSLVIWDSVLFKAYVTSKMLQNENIDMSSAVEMIEKTRQTMVEIRTDKGIEHFLIAAHKLRNSIETEAKLQEPEVRPLKKRSNMVANL
ncbi:hypothetical protein AVEN_167170-1 [Araneus ventricosus]|uniref:Uncharacterized protein n=1 Tax=Araneus ventricosus TaxID=182803 RepID=A0A4Y2G263_ARAVE|nr:hypothetical protein AVEN_167170-1 [Araneus ventricosus]